MTLRLRLIIVIVLSALSILLLAGTLVLSTQQRTQNFAQLTTALDADRVRSDVTVCVEDLHRQMSLMGQMLAFSTDADGLDEDTKEGLQEDIRQCVSHATVLGEQQRLPRDAQLAVDAIRLFEFWAQVSEDMGQSRHESALQTLALQADPLAAALINVELTAARIAYSNEVDRARAEFLSTSRTSDILLIVVGLLAVVAIVSIMALLLSLNRGVAALLFGTEQYKSGNLTHVTTISGSDELGQVAAQMNEMALALVEAQQELESRAMRLQESLHTLRETQSQLVEQQKMAALGNLVAGIAHEVNTPLGVAVTATSYVNESVTGLREQLSRRQVSRSAMLGLLDTADEGCQLSMRSLQRAADLVRSFKQVAVDRRQGAGRVLQTDEWVQGVMHSLTPLARKHMVQVVLQPPPSLSVRLAAGALEQVLTNLLVNSFVHAFSPLESRPADAAEATVTVRMEDQGSMLCLHVEDNGRGIPPEVAAHVFEPFFTTRRGQGGTGLGMHIVHQLVTALFDGSIQLDSEVGRGTRWHITIPFGTGALERVTGAVITPALTDRI